MRSIQYMAPGASKHCGFSSVGRRSDPRGRMRCDHGRGPRLGGARLGAPRWGLEGVAVAADGWGGAGCGWQAGAREAGQGPVSWEVPEGGSSLGWQLWSPCQEGPWVGLGTGDLHQHGLCSWLSAGWIGWNAGFAQRLWLLRGLRAPLPRSSSPHLSETEWPREASGKVGAGGDLPSPFPVRRHRAAAVWICLEFWGAWGASGSDACRKGGLECRAWCLRGGHSSGRDGDRPLTGSFSPQREVATGPKRVQGYVPVCPLGPRPW